MTEEKICGNCFWWEENIRWKGQGLCLKDDVGDTDINDSCNDWEEE